MPHEQAPDQQPPPIVPQPQFGLGGPAPVLVVRPGVDGAGPPRHHAHPDGDFAPRRAVDHRVRKAGGIPLPGLPGGYRLPRRTGLQVPRLRVPHLDDHCRSLLLRPAPTLC
ncbi:hypothetical protein [Streptomyces erythrochromogenes]|uniref:hypothetical protein n=1 Tax=Streptomyces erythrochromogenes TaxID=285574 RepID=UPI0036F9EFBC